MNRVFWAWIWLILRNSFRRESEPIRFLPSGYIAPHRISHNLTDRQRQILQTLSFCRGEGVTFTKVKAQISNSPADQTLRDDFQHLKRLGVVDVQGRGRGAKWALVSSDVNKAE